MRKKSFLYHKFVYLSLWTVSSRYSTWSIKYQTPEADICKRLYDPSEDVWSYLKSHMPYVTPLTLWRMQTILFFNWTFPTSKNSVNLK